MTTSQANRLVICACVMRLALIHCLTASAAGTNQLSQSSGGLKNFTLRQVVNVQAASVSKKETGLFTSPAAIFIYTFSRNLQHKF